MDNRSAEQITKDIQMKVGEKLSKQLELDPMLTIDAMNKEARDIALNMIYTSEVPMVANREENGERVVFDKTRVTEVKEQGYSTFKLEVIWKPVIMEY